MQIYGIDLAKEKFDVSFLRLSSKSNVVTPVHHVVRNTQNGIKAFLKGLFCFFNAAVSFLFGHICHLIKIYKKHRKKITNRTVYVLIVPTSFKL